MKEKKRIFLVAGEASADLYAAQLLSELKKENEIEAEGVGGDLAVKEGLRPIFHSREFSLFGFTEWMGRFSEIYGKYRQLVNAIRTRDYDVAILIDMPDMNLQLAKHLRKNNVPVVYYVSPQLWAWRKYRIQKVKNTVDKMLVLFPFEKDFYLEHGVEADFVGHPLANQVLTKQKYRSHSEIKSAPRIAVLPGSRHSELRFHAGLLSEVMELLKSKYPKIQFKIPVASTLEAREVKASLETNLPIDYVPAAEAQAALVWADVALVASGTATLETSLVGTPFCIFYQVGKLTAWIFRRVSSYRGFAGLPNLLSKDQIVQEFIQEEATVEKIFSEVVQLIENETYRTKQVDNLHAVKDLLGREPTAAKVSAHVAEFLGREPHERR